MIGAKSQMSAALTFLDAGPKPYAVKILLKPRVMVIQGINGLAKAMSMQTI